MAMHPDKRHIPKPLSSVIHWLLDSDSSIRWQVLRNLTDASEEEVVAERARVAIDGWGAAFAISSRATEKHILELCQETPCEAPSPAGLCQSPTANTANCVDFGGLKGNVWSKIPD